MAEAAERVRTSGIAAMLYTSPPHRASKPRYRVLCPTSGALPPAAWERLIARVNGVLDGQLAPGSSPCRSRSIGSVEGQAPARVELVDCRYIDSADGLHVGALDRRGVAAEPDEDDDDMAREPDIERIERALRLCQRKSAKHG